MTMAGKLELAVGLTLPVATEAEMAAAELTSPVVTEPEVTAAVRGIEKAARGADPVVSIAEMTEVVSIGDITEVVKVTTNRTR